MTRRSLFVASAAAFGALALTFAAALPAHAHITVTPDTTEPGAYALLTVNVSHGCGTSPTTAISVQIPEPINAVTPTVNAGWNVEKVFEKLATPLEDSHGNRVTERVSEIVYTATTPLPADYRDAFVLSVKLPEEAAGKTLTFPTVQSCAEAEAAWVQLSAEGEDPHELEFPAPSFAVAKVATAANEGAAGDSAGKGSSVTAAGVQSSDAAGSAAEASNLTLTIAALGVAVLALAAAVLALVRTRRRA